MPVLARIVSSSAAATLGLMGTATVEAHAAIGTTPGNAGNTAVALLIVLSAVAYAVGLRRIWQRGHDARRRHALRAVAFACGLLSLAAALLSPLDGWADQLFCLHMIQHELLMLVAAPLLVAGRPLPLYLWALPNSVRASTARVVHRPVVHLVWRGLLSPPVAWSLHALTLWLWHIPALFDAVLRNALLHDLQHFTFLAAALCFWAALFEARRPDQQGAAVIYLFTTTVHTSVLGALITFASHPWYAPYLQIPRAWGLTGLEDQEVGGLIMWVPGSMVYVGMALVLLAHWLRASEKAVGGAIYTRQ